MFHSVWWHYPLFDFLYILWHSSLINLALKQRLTTTRKWPTVSIEKNVFKNVLMTRFSRHLLSSNASSLDSSRSPSPCFETMTSNKLTNWEDRDVRNLITSWAVGHRNVPGFTTKWNIFLLFGNSTFAPTEISGFLSLIESAQQVTFYALVFVPIKYKSMTYTLASH